MTENQLSALYDATVVSEADGKIGKVGTVYLDDDTQQPSWVTVKTGLFGSAESFVPLAAANLSGDEVRVSYSKDKVKDAPRMDTDSELSPAEEDELYRYYGLGRGASTGTETGTTGTAAGTAGTAGVRGDRDPDGDGHIGRGHDTSGPNTDDAMTRSEERVNVGTQQRESGVARLRKHIVTERVSQEVPVSHEEAVVNREPITDANRGDALSGGDLTEEEHEVTLHEERAVVNKETVPVERVSLGTQTVQETETVSTDARREEIEVVEGDTTRGDRR
ncbi:PRC and DUF2382 domain-containing protein [uncultured Pseudokineococcus sp.]|uniref:PRC and DUF2382 domain-containing protein n=1 Tax=uncultured Pseudokineococcus sp. TaxID=1642928 RepID=UPI00342E78A0